MSAANSFHDIDDNALNTNMHRNHQPGINSRIAAIAALLLTSLSFAQTDDLRLPMQLDADSTNYDGKSSMLMFQGLRLSQGNLGIAADEGRATKMDFEDSVWHFAGNVVIDVENGHIECDSADIIFSGYQLRMATISGSPATFRMERPGTEQVTYAEAGRLQYDFDEGVVEFSENATITEGGNQIASNYLVYNIREQRINASSGGDGDPKVRITYTPGDVEGLLPNPAPEDNAEEGIENGEAEADVPEGNGETG
jgi:lipopolysaccharide transport protein LptA